MGTRSVSLTQFKASGDERRGHDALTCINRGGGAGAGA